MATEASPFVMQLAVAVASGMAPVPGVTPITGVPPVETQSLYGWLREFGIVILVL